MRRFGLLSTLCLVLVALPAMGARATKELKVTSIQCDKKLPLVEALRRIGLHLRGGFVSFGVDISDATEPEVDVNMPDTDLGDALRRITSQIAGYTSEIVSEHVVDVYATRDRANPDDPLNLAVREFSVTDVQAISILSEPMRYIPELKDYLSKGRTDDKKSSQEGCGHFVSEMKSNAPGVTIFLTGRTVRQILDAVAEADAALPALPDAKHLRPYPLGWVHLRKNDPKLALVHTWSAVSFAPHDWNQYAPK